MRPVRYLITGGSGYAKGLTATPPPRVAQATPTP